MYFHKICAIPFQERIRKKHLIMPYKIIGLLVSAVLLSGCASDLLTPPYKDHPNLQMAEMTRLQGDVPQAIQMYKEIIKESQPCEKAYIGLGMSLLDANAVDEAKKVFEKALGLFPNSARAFIGMGAVFLTINQPERALKSFDCALRIDPRNAQALNGRGIALDMLGNFDEAQANYRAAIELCPSNLSYQSNLALSRALAGDTVEAIRVLERLSCSPEATPRIRQNLSLVYGLAGDMKAAKKIGRKDLSEDMLRNNICYMEAIQKSKEFGGLISKNHTIPLDGGRKWQEK